MDLRRTENDGLQRLGEIWKTTPGAELEAMLLNLDLTGWQDVIQYLRSLGMREAPQIVKMNICLSNDIRLTLEGAGVIQAYCRDNRIGDKPFVAMLKEAVADAEPVTLNGYAVKAKLKREIPLAADDARVKEALARWDQLGKHFRNIQRFEFVAPGGIPIRFDVSIVRENAGKPARTFQEARVTTQPPRYEAEVEVTAARDSTKAATAVAHLLRGISWLLQGRQRSFVLVSRTAEDYVRASLGGIFGSGFSGSSGSNRNRNGSGGPFRYPGPQPATLERRNMLVEADAEPGVPNLRTMPGGYNVTDKADGLRCALFVADNGNIFLVDGGGRVYATGKQTEKSAAGMVLDGEWIRRDRNSRRVSHYYAFDILAYRGSTDITKEPFMIAGDMLSAGATRHAVMTAVVGGLGTATQRVGRVPPEENLQIGVKTFRPCGAGSDIFTKCAAATLEDAKSAPYTTDGLIFTPNSMPLPLGRGTWYEQLKWKPPHENTIDFLVLIDRERDSGVDTIGTKYREDAGQTVRYKTLRLFVGSNRDGAFADPRITVLGSEALPRSLDEGEWREVEFRPVEPRDPMASVCFVALQDTSSGLDVNTDVIRSKAGDVIQSDMIVEMAYHPERAPGWRWEPTRVRHDKTERWLAQQAGRGRKGGTMNADWVANSIWTSIHNPVTEEAVRTGRIIQCAAPETLVAASSVGGRRTPGRDALKMQCMRNFHDHVKRNLIRRLVTAGSTVCDLAMGNGDDISKWIAAPVAFAFGCDVLAPAINGPDDGAYRRLLDKMVELGGRDRVPPMMFAQADMARRLVTGEAGMTADDQALLQSVFGAGGAGANAFDTVTCMFAMEYMFRDPVSLDGFLNNLADTVKVGGYFAGCGLDGDSVARLLAADGSVVVKDGRTDVWMMTKRYGSGIGNSVPPSASGLGLAVDVDFIVAGEARTQYLMSWPYMQARLAECGLELLNAEELTTLGLPSSTQMFGDSADRESFSMTDAVRRYSVLNRWFVFRRRSERRPSAPTAVPAPPVGLTEVVSEKVSELGPRPRTGENKVLLPAVAGAGGPLSPIEEGAAEMPSLTITEKSEEKVSKDYFINPTASDDARLGPALADWPRYLSLAAQVEIVDLGDATIRYPSIEAAIASAKFQKATDKAALGPQIFRVEGSIHQSYVRKRESLAPPALPKSIEDESTAVRVASSPGKIKAYGAVWNPEAWTAQKMDLYRAYLQQRFTADARFREMIVAIKEKGGNILFVNGTDANELGVGVRKDGSLAGGENKIGKLMQILA
jgi:hypothetical protein